jgi:hypothetical protein
MRASADNGPFLLVGSIKTDSTGGIGRNRGFLETETIFQEKIITGAKKKGAESPPFFLLLARPA